MGLWMSVLSMHSGYPARQPFLSFGARTELCLGNHSWFNFRISELQVD